MTPAEKRAQELRVEVIPPPTAYKYWSQEQWSAWSDLMLDDIPPTEVPAPMDVNATLSRIRELTNREVNELLTNDETQELRMLFDALDSYLANGGNIPRDWRPFLCSSSDSSYCHSYSRYSSF